MYYKYIYLQFVHSCNLRRVSGVPCKLNYIHTVQYSRYLAGLQFYGPGVRKVPQSKNLVCKVSCITTSLYHKAPEHKVPEHKVREHKVPKHKVSKLKGP